MLAGEQRLSHLSKSTLSITSSLSALVFGVVMWVSMKYLPEQQSIQAFFVLFPAALILAILGYILGTISRNSRSAMLGFLIGGGILMAIAVALMLPAF
jgi:hypothetical protein